MSIESMAAVLHHSKARGTDKLVLLGIANHDGDGGAWPTITTLAKYANCGETRVKQALRHLIELGEVSRDLNAGGTHSIRNDRRPNLYRILIGCPADCDGSVQHRTGGTRSAARSGARGAQMTVTGGTPSVPEPSISQPSTRTTLSIPAAADGFDEFWSVYPRREAKSAARRAWDRAIRSTPEAVIIAGALRYAMDPNREPSFTAHGATWLNQGRWDDDPLPPRAGNRQSATSMYVEVARDSGTLTTRAIGS